MAEVLVFHHALGLTEGLRDFEATVRSAGHTVTTPDLFDGKTFATVNEGVAYAASIGFDTISDRGVAAVDGLGEQIVAIGFSLGVIPAQRLAQTRPGVLGAILCHAALPSSAFGGPWPDGVALQIHIGDSDPWAEEDLPVAEDLASEARGDLFIYEGTGHLIADPSSEDYDAAQADLLLQRSLAFIGNL
jgi:dienelactone hydrolase